MIVVNYKFLKFNQLSVDDLYQILKLRTEVFVLEQQCAYQDLDGMDQHAWHVLGMNVNKKIVSYARILSPEQCDYNFCSIGRVVVKKSFRQENLGRQLMTAAIDFTKNKFTEHLIQISAQTYLSKFYQSLGFVNTGNFYLEDDIPHQTMVYQPQ